MTGRTLAWTGGAVTSVATAGLITYFAAVGLDEANKIASVISAIIGLAGLAVAVYGVLVAHRSPPQPVIAPAAPTAASGGHSVTDSEIGGDNIMIGDVGNDVNIGRPES